MALALGLPLLAELEAQLRRAERARVDAIKPTDGFEALLQPEAKVDEPKTASKGKRKAHGDGLARQPIHGESYDTYADGVRRSVRNRSGGASSSADWSAAPKARSG